MKKLMTALTICAVASFATAADVTSPNVVGYITRTINTGAGEFMSNVGVPLKCMSALDGSYTVANNLFDYVCQPGDTVYVFNPANWDLDSYSYNGIGLGWFLAASDGTTHTIASFQVMVGANIFFAPANGSSPLTISGEVKTSGAQQVVFDASGSDYIWPITNPFPIETKFSDIETFALAGDTVYVFNPMNWDLDSYSYNGVGLGWFLAASNGTTSTILVDQVLFPVGTGGFFMTSGGSRTWTVTLNYTP